MTSPLAQMLLFLAGFCAASGVASPLCIALFVMGVVLEVARNVGIGTPKDPPVRQ